MICEKIWLEQRLPCVWSFRRNRTFSRDGFYYLKMMGFCSDKKINCKATITCRIEEKPAPNSSVIIIVEAFNTFGIPHVKSRFLKDENRVVVKSTLKNMRASRYKKKKANELMNYSDVKPPQLQTTMVFRKAKQEGKNFKAQMLQT